MRMAGRRRASARAWTRWDARRRARSGDRSGVGKRRRARPRGRVAAAPPRADVCGSCGLTHSKHSGDDVETPPLHCVSDGENRPKWLAHLAFDDVHVTGRSAGTQRQLGRRSDPPVGSDSSRSVSKLAESGRQHVAGHSRHVRRTDEPSRPGRALCIDRAQEVGRQRVGHDVRRILAGPARLGALVLQDGIRRNLDRGRGQRRRGNTARARQREAHERYGNVAVLLRGLGRQTRRHHQQCR